MKKKKTKNVIRTPKLFMKWKGWIDAKRYGSYGCKLYLKSIENRLLSRYCDIITELEEKTFENRNRVPAELTEYGRLKNGPGSSTQNSHPENVTRESMRNKAHKESLEVLMGNQHVTNIHETFKAQLKMDELYRPANEKVKAYLLGVSKRISDFDEYDLPRGSDMLELEKKTWEYLDNQISVFGHKHEKDGERVC